MIVGAHHDHVGKAGQRNVGRRGGASPDDDIWNGADDNASGTTGVLAIARAFHLAGIRPRRGVIFMTFSGEEWGLLGSKYYVAHPVVPLKQTVAMINMDMIGRGSLDKPSKAFGLGTLDGPLFREAVERSGARAGVKFKPASGYGGRSDHASFAARRIPILGIGENGVGQSDYHRRTDHADKINYEYLTPLARAAFLCVAELANADEVPGWNPKFKVPPPRRLLGVSVEPVEGGLSIQSISADSVAERSGLREGDVIVSFGGKPFPKQNPRTELGKRIQKVKPGEEVKIEVLRDGKKQTVTAVWKEQ